MIDREKVIKGVTCCTSADRCYECPYKDERDEIYSGFCEQVLKHDVLAILKEQDAIEPVNPLSPAWGNIYFCGKCGYPVGKHNNYCSECGKKVKWDD